MATSRSGAFGRSASIELALVLPSTLLTGRTLPSRPTLAFENDRTLRRLRDLAVDIPDVDEAAISRYWDFVDR